MDFDEWNASPYTKVLHDSIANDYVPRADLLSAVAAEREACAKVAEGSEQTRDWFPTSLWANLRNEIAARIRMRSNTEIDT